MVKNKSIPCKWRFPLISFGNMTPYLLQRNVATRCSTFLKNSGHSQAWSRIQIRKKLILLTVCNNNSVTYNLNITMNNKYSKSKLRIGILLILLYRNDPVSVVNSNLEVRSCGMVLRHPSAWLAFWFRLHHCPVCWSKPSQ